MDRLASTILCGIGAVLGFSHTDNLWLWYTLGVICSLGVLANIVDLFINHEE